MVKYGLLVHSTENLGDDIQSLAAKQFLPRVDVFIDRDYMDKVRLDEKIKVIMNGWFTHRPKTFPPPPLLEPLFISFHITPVFAKEILKQKFVEYLKKYEIGCRDSWTLKLLRRKRLKAYFSGCLTLTLDYGYKVPRKTEKILIVDIAPDVLRLIPKSVIDRAEILSHELVNSDPPFYLTIMPSTIRKVLKAVIPRNYGQRIYRRIYYKTIHKRATRISLEERLRKAEDEIKKLASASIVITSRLHAALPAVAFGTPVIFIAKNINDPRFSGLTKFFNCYTLKEFESVVNKMDWENPPENPNQDELKNLKNNIIEIVRNFIKSDL